MKKSFFFLAFSLIALMSSITACAQASPVEQDMSSIDQPLIFSEPNESIYQGDELPSVVPFRVMSIEQSYPADALPGEYVIVMYDDDRYEKVGMRWEECIYPVDRSEDLYELAMLTRMIDPPYFNESVRPISPQYYLEHGLLANGKVLCQYQVPISPKKARKMIRQMYEKGQRIDRHTARL